MNITMNKLKDIYIEGWIKIGRYIVFSFYMGLALIPAQLISILIAPAKEWQLYEYPIHSSILILLAIIYLPLCVYWASKMSNQLNTPINR